MAQPNSEDHGVPTSDVDANQPVKVPPIRYDFGALLKENPHVYRIAELCIAYTSWLHLQLRARVVFCAARSHFFQLVAIDCINAVDYSIRPANPALLEGGPCIKYYEKHELLQNVSRAVPNTDGMQMWDPSKKFTLLNIDQSYIIAQRFEMSILGDGVTGWSGRTPMENQQMMESLKRALDSIDKYRLPLKRDYNSSSRSA
jgi:hypothetical protein